MCDSCATVVNMAAAATSLTQGCRKTFDDSAVRDDVNGEEKIGQMVKRLVDSAYSEARRLLTEKPEDHKRPEAAPPE